MLLASTRPSWWITDAQMESYEENVIDIRGGTLGSVELDADRVCQVEETPSAKKSGSGSGEAARRSL